MLSSPAHFLPGPREDEYEVKCRVKKKKKKEIKKEKDKKKRQKRDSEGGRKGLEGYSFRVELK